MIALKLCYKTMMNEEMQNFRNSPCQDQEIINQMKELEEVRFQALRELKRKAQSNHQGILKVKARRAFFEEGSDGLL